MIKINKRIRVLLVAIITTTILVISVIVYNIAQSTKNTAQNNSTNSTTVFLETVEKDENLIILARTNPEKKHTLVKGFIESFNNGEIKELIKNDILSGEEFETLLYFSEDEYKKNPNNQIIKKFVEEELYNSYSNTGQITSSFDGLIAYAQDSCLSTGYILRGDKCYQQFSFGGDLPANVTLDISTSYESRDEMSEVIKSALSEILLKFAEAGFELNQDDDILLLIKDTIYVDPTGVERTGVEASAHRSGESCILNVFSTIALNYFVFPAINHNQFKYVVAHEIFHCVQYKYFPDQMRVFSEFKNWWSEGTAEFMAEYTYPSFGYEDYFNSPLETYHNNLSLFEFSYSNYLFFQSINNNSTISSIKDFMSKMSTQNSLSSQITALKSTDQIDNQFENYQKNLLIIQHRDTSGDIKRLYPAFLLQSPKKIFWAFDTVDFEAKSFVLQGDLLEIMPSAIQREARIETLEGEGKVSFYDHNTRSWSDKPSIPTIDSCDDNPTTPKNYIVATTNTHPTLNQFKARLTIDDGSGDTHMPSLDPDIIGTWIPNRQDYEEFIKSTVDNNPSLLASMRANNLTREEKIWSVQSTVKEYASTVCYLSDGTYLGLSNVTLNIEGFGFSPEFGAGTGSLEYTTSTSVRGKFKTDSSSITYYDTESQNTNSSLTVRVPLLGIQRVIPIADSTNFETNEVQVPYSITDSTLTTSLVYGENRFDFEAIR